MLLRPPLRTHKRILWEAELEQIYNKDNWKPSGSLGPNIIFNNHSRNIGGNNISFNQHTYRHFNKCNIFVSEISLRSGFKIVVHRTNANRFHYLDANSYANQSQRSQGINQYIDLVGRGEDRRSIWGRNLDNWLRSIPTIQLQTVLNNAMNNEGRCFILACARKRKFIERDLPGGTKGIADCGNYSSVAGNIGSLRTWGIGHIVLVKQVLNQPVVRYIPSPVVNPERGLSNIRISTLEASGKGVVSREFEPSLNGIAASVDANIGFIRIHLIELQPGDDPDTIRGQRNLNVRELNRNLLDTPNEAAIRKRLTHNPDGSLVAPPAPCENCSDNHPAGDANRVNC
jgi:hypothetical protein